jgi:O-succinylhomoserine sulfhydrylase
MNAKMSGSMDEDWDFETRAVRAGTQRTGFGEHAEALFMTSSFTFGSAAEAAERFQPTSEGFVYSRFSNPTVEMFQDRLAALEDAEACLATASGMSAILTTCLGLLNAGDHIVASRSLFGATVQLFNTILGRFGITTTYVDPVRPEAWSAALRDNTKLFFAETPSNPTAEVVDIAALKAIAAPRGVLLVVDNCFCTPALQRPLALGADLVVHSATKFLDGQGRVIGGAVLGSRSVVREKLLPVLRSAGPSLSPFNAWILLKGLETLSLRMERQSANALTLARWLERHPRVARVAYPGLDDHPQAELVRRQQKAGGAVVSFVVKVDGDDTAERAAAWRVVDGCRLISITANLGDTRSTITHPATTTHGRVPPDVRRTAGIGEGMVRVAVGLENVEDLQRDLARGLDAST